MRTPDRVIALVPRPLRPFLFKHPETVKFLLTGGTCYMITVVLNYLLKLTVLTEKTTIALIIATIISTIVSYVINREWSFSTRGGRRRHAEITLFIIVNIIAIVITAAPQYAARNIFDVQTPNVSFAVQEVSDFLNGLVLGTALAMVFRLWAFKHWVFPAKPEDDYPIRSSRQRAAVSTRSRL